VVGSNFVLTFDFLLWEVTAELSAMGRHLDLIESSLPRVIRAELDAAWTSLVEAGFSDDESEVEAVMQPLRFELEVLHPRYVRSSFLVMLASMMEAALTDIGDSWADFVDHAPFSDLPKRRDEGFIGRFARFFREELTTPLNIGEDELERMELLYGLRNKLAHNGGRPLSEEDRRKFERWGREVPGITYELNFLSFSEDFVRHTFDVVRDSLSRLVTDVRVLRDSHARESSPQA